MCSFAHIVVGDYSVCNHVSKKFRTKYKKRRISQYLPFINRGYHLKLHNIYINSFPSSCSETSELNAFSSGYYTLISSRGDLNGVYCDLNRTFGGNSTGWMKVAELDVNNCPQGFRNYIVSADKTYVVSEDSAGCTEIRYPVYKIQHTKLTGRIRAYQIYSLDVKMQHLKMRMWSPTVYINSNYLNGISLTSNGLHV